VKQPGKIKPKSSIGGIHRFFFHLRVTIQHHPYFWLIVTVVLSLFALLYWRRKSGHGLSMSLPMWGDKGYFKLDGKEGLLGNGGGNGKVD
jgi:protein disulfide-isomerase